MNWYYEYRNALGEADSNVWIYGWTPEGFSRDERWWFRHLPRWMKEGPVVENKVTPEQADELEEFRQGMQVNVVVALRHYDTTPLNGLRMYF